MKKILIELQNCDNSLKAHKEYSLYFCRSLLSYIQGDYQSAYGYAGQALIMQRKSNKNLFSNLYRLITIAAAWGKPQIAREYFIELIEFHRKNRISDKSYWQRYYTYRGMGHYYASYSKIEEDIWIAKKYYHRSFMYYRRAMIVAEQIDHLLCITGWQQKVADDIASLESANLPKPILCDR